jgi:CRISPR-associated endonuclease/helicase Cas3
MAALTLRILPVYSEYHPNALLGEVRLLKHQQETLDAFDDPAIDLVMDTAITGDGKSIAAYLPAFKHGFHVVAMYPTNELVRDQYRALANYQRDFGLSLPPCDTMYSQRITHLMREYQTAARLDQVEDLIRNNGILLTNPDLIHLILSYQYGWDFLRKELPVITSASFDYFLFDESHVLGVPQVVSVMNMLGYLTAYYARRPKKRKKYVFLSATPDPLLEQLLRKNGLRCKIINGSYRTTPLQDAYRCILQPCDITLISTDHEMTIESWIEGHFNDLLRFFQDHPDSKAAIIVSSPATARRLVERLRTFFAPHQITIGENTGLYREPLDRQILVGTSTVDVGIDFHINYLIFEAFDAGSFLQRFGRLGRHGEFSCYRAYGLIPHFVLERLAMTFADQAEVERTQLNTAIREAFPAEQTFVSYPHRWGVLQAAHVVNVLRSQSKLDANQAFTEELVAQYERIYGRPGKPAFPRAGTTYWRLSKNTPQVLADLLSFRGQSPFQCGVWDTTIVSPEYPQGYLLTYNLFFLLANTEFEVLEEREFLEEVRRRGLEERDFVKQLLYLKIIRYIPERPQLILGFPHHATGSPGLLHRVSVTSGFLVRQPRHTWLNEVNKALKKLPLTSIVVEGERQELRRTLKLGGIFPLYRLEDQTGYEYTVAFGQEALLLDALLRWRKSNTNHPLMA